MQRTQAVYRLIPFAIPKPWGGGHLDCLARNSANEHIGEYVLFSDLTQFPVKIAVSGREILLSDFWTTLGLSLPEIPFMLKILSTADPISLQNHPSDADVAELGLSGNGKFECWSILAADDNARAYLGLRDGENASVLRSLNSDTKPLSHFNEFFPRSGDVIKLIPGLIHSTTGRLLFYEVQQKSDHTFRIYDFSRGRKLHLEEAIHCVKNQKAEIGKFTDGLQTENFSVAYRHVSSSSEFIRKGKEFSVYTWFGSPAKFIVDEESFSLTWGDSLLVLTSSRCRIEKKTDGPKKTSASGDLPMIDMLFEAYI